MAGRMQGKMHDTTNYQGRNFEMNISKNKYLSKMEKKEKARLSGSRKTRR